MQFALDSVTARQAVNCTHAHKRIDIDISLILRPNSYISTVLDIRLDNCSETMAAPRFSSALDLVVYAAPKRLRPRHLTGLKCLGTAQTYAVIWFDWHHQTRHSLVFLKSPPLYIYRAHSCR